MPLNLAFTGINRADAIPGTVPRNRLVDYWGHSLGGAMAAQYAKTTSMIWTINHVRLASREQRDFIDFRFQFCR